MSLFSKHHVMTAFGCPKLKVTSIKQSPLNKLQWSVTLTCGHDLWITSRQKPKRKTAYCTKCGEQAIQ